MLQNVFIFLSIRFLMINANDASAEGLWEDGDGVVLSWTNWCTSSGKDEVKRVPPL